MKASQTDTLSSGRANPGETLREAREARGMSLGEAAHQLNLTQLSVSHIESGAFDRLPGHTFARGYVRAYAKLMEIDQAQLVADFDQYTGTNASGSDVHSLGRIAEPSKLSQNLLRIVSFALLVVLCAVGFFWWQEQGGAVRPNGVSMEQVEVDSADGTTEIHSLAEPEDQAAEEAQATPEPTPGTLPPEVAGDPDMANNGVPGSPAPAPAAPVSPAGDGSAATAETPPQPGSATPNNSLANNGQPATPAPGNDAGSPVEGAATSSAQGMLRIAFTADCWTQVTDADGKVLVSKLQREGDRLSLAGKPPLSLRLGFARGAQVTYNGESVDVMSQMRGETARVTVGQ